MLLMAVFVVALWTLHYLLKSRTLGFWTPDGIFVTFQLLLCVGTFYLVNPHDPVELEYARIITLAFAVYVFVSIVAGQYIYSVRGSRYSEARSVLVTRPGGLFILALVASVLISAVYYYFVGYNTFLIGIQSVFAPDGDDADIATLRIESYGGSRYLFPGYVNQFKNILLPALSVVLIHWMYSASIKWRHLTSAALVAVTLLLLLGTGQRGAFVVFGLTIVTYLARVFGRRALGYVVKFSAVFVPALLLATLANQRSEPVDGSGLVGMVRATVSQLATRVLFDNQASGIRGFHYTHDLDIQYGKEWIKGLIGLLPRVQGSSLSNEIFATAYGSLRGTSPPSLWGSVHYNFGLLGLVVFAAMLAVGLTWLGHWLDCRESVSTLGAIGMAGVSVVFGTWLAGGPDYLLNNGLVPFLVLTLLGSRRALSRDTSRHRITVEEDVVGARRSLPVAHGKGVC